LTVCLPACDPNILSHTNAAWAVLLVVELTSLQKSVEIALRIAENEGEEEYEDYSPCLASSASSPGSWRSLNSDHISWNRFLSVIEEEEGGMREEKRLRRGESVFELSHLSNLNQSVRRLHYFHCFLMRASAPLARVLQDRVRQTRIEMTSGTVALPQPIRQKFVSPPIIINLRGRRLS
jgi:hypothetical protein